MENYIVSARKYRPSTFSQVVGQDSITSTLKSAIVNHHLAQAFLFTGPRGVGKTTCARILAKTINCLNPTADGEPCNECESCKAFNENSSFNIHELDAASNNSVDDIRALVNQVRIPPQVGKYKVYIIDEVHMLSQAAFNAFLKTLEEPPEYAKFILATTEKHKIIPTILSRCQIFDFKRIGVEDIANYLSYVAHSEKIEADEEALHIIAEKSDGALRDALSTFDQIVSYSGDNITYAGVIENLNILDYEYYFRMTDALLKSDVSELLLIYDEINDRGFDGQQVLTGLSEHLRNLLVVSNSRTASLLLTSATVRERFKQQAQFCSVDFLFKALEICNKYDLNYKSSNNKRLHVEIALTQLASLHVGDTLDRPTTIRPSYASQPKPTATPANESKGKYKQLSQPTKEHSLAQPAKTPTEQTMLQKEEPEKWTSKQEPDPKTNAASLQHPTTQLKKTAESQNGNRRPMRNISIKDSLEALRKQKNKTEEAEQPVIDNPISQDQLSKAWNLFVVSYKEQSPSFVLTLAKAEPKIEAGFSISYKVPNALVAGDTLNVSVLKNFLIKELNNNQITLKPVVDKKSESNEAYTDRERFDALRKKFPKLNDLKEKFKLELDF